MYDDPAQCLTASYGARIEDLGKAVRTVGPYRLFYDARVKLPPRQAGEPTFPPFTERVSRLPWIDQPRTPAADRWFADLARAAGVGDQAKPPSSDDEPLLSDEVRGEVLAANETLITTELSFYLMAEGAAHGSAAVRGHVWLVKPGRTLAAADLFGTKTDWADTLAALTLAELRTVAKADGWEAELEGKKPADLLDTVRDPANWTVVAAGLGVQFQPYEVGPWAIGAPRAVVPWDRLAPLLQPALPFTRPTGG
jgi:hypothetical protein